MSPIKSAIAQTRHVQFSFDRDEAFARRFFRSMHFMWTFNELQHPYFGFSLVIPFFDYDDSDYDRRFGLVRYAFKEFDDMGTCYPVHFRVVVQRVFGFVYRWRLRCCGRFEYGGLWLDLGGDL